AAPEPLDQLVLAEALSRLVHAHDARAYAGPRSGELSRFEGHPDTEERRMKRASIGAWAIAMVMIMAALASAQRDPREAWLTSLITTIRALPNTESDVRGVCEAPLPSGVSCSPTPGGRYPCTLPS